MKLGWSIGTLLCFAAMPAAAPAAIMDWTGDESPASILAQPVLHLMDIPDFAFLRVDLAGLESDWPEQALLIALIDPDAIAAAANSVGESEALDGSLLIAIRSDAPDVTEHGASLVSNPDAPPRGTWFCSILDPACLLRGATIAEMDNVTRTEQATHTGLSPEHIVTQSELWGVEFVERAPEPSSFIFAALLTLLISFGAWVGERPQATTPRLISVAREATCERHEIAHLILRHAPKFLDEAEALDAAVSIGMPREAARTFLAAQRHKRGSPEIPRDLS